MVGQENAKLLWATATLALSAIFDETNPTVIRNYLRSRHGRHLGDHVTFFAKEKDYGDMEAMHDAVREAVCDVIKRGRDKGRSLWRETFDKIKRVTENGEWTD